MAYRPWAYHLREAWLGIYRNGLMSFASVTTVAICLFLVASFALLALNMEYLADTVEAQVQVVAYLQPDLPADRQQSLLEEVRRWPGAGEVELVTPEQALARLRQQFGEQRELLDGVDEMNVLPPSLEVQVPDPAAVDRVVAALQDAPGVDSVRYNQQVMEQLYAVTASVRTVGLILVGLLAAATIFLIANTVRLTVFARREEIGILKLVGATDGFVRWPFLLQGALLGVSGAALAAVATLWGYGWFVRAAREAVPFLPLLSPGAGRLDGLGEALLAAGFLLGAVGSVLSLRRHLRV